MKATIKLSVEGLNAAICNKPVGFNLWVMKCYNKATEKRTFSDFYNQLMFTVANF